MRTLFLSALASVAILTTAATPAPVTKVSKPFAGAKVNGGTVTMVMDAGKVTLTLSDDFKVPDTPDPHWQVVDTKGNVFLLNRLTIKGDKQNRTITLPPYVNDVAKVQIWCAFAEVLLGEASFAKPIVTASGEARGNGMKADSGMKHDSMAMSKH